MADHGLGVEGQVRARSMHDRAHTGVLHRNQRAGVAVHAELEPAEGVSGKPADGRGHLFRAGQPGRLSKRRSDRPRAGGRHDDMENVHPEQHTYCAHRVHGLVERPKP